MGSQLVCGLYGVDKRAKKRKKKKEKEKEKKETQKSTNHEDSGMVDGTEKR
jgi:hypothetical protein